MDDKKLSKICFVILIVNLILFALFYSQEFPQKNLSQLINKVDSKGRVFGRVDHIISDKKNTIFIFSEDISSKVFYPKEINLKKGDFVWVYATTQKYKNQIELHAHKIIKETSELS